MVNTDRAINELRISASTFRITPDRLNVLGRSSSQFLPSQTRIKPSASITVLPKSEPLVLTNHTLNHSQSVDRFKKLSFTKVKQSKSKGTQRTLISTINFKQIRLIPRFLAASPLV